MAGDADDLVVHRMLRWTDANAPTFPWELAYFAQDRVETLEIPVTERFRLFVGPLRGTIRMMAVDIARGGLVTETRLGFVDDPPQQLVGRTAETTERHVKAAIDRGSLETAAPLNDALLRMASALTRADLWERSGKLGMEVGFAEYKLGRFQDAAATLVHAANAVLRPARSTSAAARALYWAARSYENASDRTAAVRTYRQFLQAPGYANQPEKQADALQRLGRLASPAKGSDES